MFENDADPKNLPIIAKAVISPFRSVIHKEKSKFPNISLISVGRDCSWNTLSLFLIEACVHAYIWQDYLGESVFRLLLQGLSVKLIYHSRNMKIVLLDTLIILQQQ